MANLIGTNVDQDEGLSYPRGVSQAPGVSQEADAPSSPELPSDNKPSEESEASQRRGQGSRGAAGRGSSAVGRGTRGTTSTRGTLRMSQLPMGIDTRRHMRGNVSHTSTDVDINSGKATSIVFSQNVASKLRHTNSNLSISSRSSSKDSFEDTRVRVLGSLSPKEEWLMLHSTDMVHTVVKWILFEVSRLTITKRLLIAPPILARVYQELSNGMLGYFMACKIADVPFPFPFAQFLQYALYAFFLFCPFLVLENMRKWDLTLTWLCLPINFLACAGFAALNEISIELEEPFGTDENDYPIHIQQWTIVQAMEDCFFQEQPKDFDFTCMGEADPERKLDLEIEERIKQANGRYSVRRTPPAPEKAASAAASAAVGTKFDELRGTILAATRWLQNHRSEKHADMPDQARLNRLIEALQEVPTQRGITSSNNMAPGAAAPSSVAPVAGAGDAKDGSPGGVALGNMTAGAVTPAATSAAASTEAPCDADLNQHAALRSAFTSAFELEVVAPCFSSKDDAPPTGEALSAALKEIIDSSSDPELKQELKALVKQHEAASQILDIARRRCPEIFMDDAMYPSM